MSKRTTVHITIARYDDFYPHGGYTKADFDARVAPLLSLYGARIVQGDYTSARHATYELTFPAKTLAREFHGKLDQTVKALHPRAQFAIRIVSYVRTTKPLF